MPPLRLGVAGSTFVYAETMPQVPVLRLGQAAKDAAPDSAAKPKSTSVEKVKKTEAVTEAELEGLPPRATRKEQYELANQCIKEGLTTALAVCAALWHIKAQKLYTEGGYRSYPKYCQKELGELLALAIDFYEELEGDELNSEVTTLFNRFFAAIVTK